MNGVALAQALAVSGFGGFGRVVGAAAAVHVGEGVADAVALGFVYLVIEKAAAYDFERLARLQRMPYGFDAGGDVVQDRHSIDAVEGVSADGGSRLYFVFGQGDDQGDAVALAHGFGQILDERVEFAELVVVVRDVARVGYQLVYEYDAWGYGVEKAAQLGCSRSRPSARGVSDDVVSVLPAELVGDDAPYCVERVAGVSLFSRGGGDFVAVYDCDFAGDSVVGVQPRLSDDFADFAADAPLFGVGVGVEEVFARVDKRVAAVDEVVERDEAVGFAAAEYGFGLDDGLAAVARKPLEGVDEQGFDAAGEVGSQEEGEGVGVVPVGASGVNVGQAGGEAGLGGIAADDVFARLYDFAPSLERGAPAVAPAAASGDGLGGAGGVGGRGGLGRARSGGGRRVGGGRGRGDAHLVESVPNFLDGGLGVRRVYRLENVRHVGYAGHGGFAPDVAPVLGMAGGVADVPNLAEGAEDGAVVLEVVREEVAPVVADDEVEVADVEHVSDVFAAGAGA